MKFSLYLLQNYRVPNWFKILTIKTNYMRINLILSFAALLALTTGCEKKSGIDDDLSFVRTAKTSNPGNVFDISNDNSGRVTITPTAEGASSFTVIYGTPAGGSDSAL